MTGGSSEGVSKLFASYGFHPTRYRISADDHIACELEFMQYLVGQEILAAREFDLDRVNDLRGVQLSFIREHLLSWIDKFQQVIEQRSETTFYPALGQMTKGWLLIDEANLEGGEHGER